MDAECELYQFVTNAGTYRYTSRSEDVTAGGQVYTAVAIGRGSTSASDDLNRAAVTVRTANDLIYVTDALTSGYYGTLTIYAWDGDAEAYEMTWNGPVVSISLQGAESQITSEHILSYLRRDGLFARFQVLCRHALYGTACGLDAASFNIPGTVTVINGAAVTATGLDAVADSWLVAGRLVGPSGESRMIAAHTGETVTLLTPMASLIVGDTVTAYYGCDRTLATCRDVFTNIDNFGGFPWLPRRHAGEWASSFSH